MTMWRRFERLGNFEVSSRLLSVRVRSNAMRVELRVPFHFQTSAFPQHSVATALSSCLRESLSRNFEHSVENAKFEQRNESESAVRIPQFHANTKQRTHASASCSSYAADRKIKNKHFDHAAATRERKRAESESPPRKLRGSRKTLEKFSRAAASNAAACWSKFSSTQQRRTR